ncbi:hypothetical protein RDI58_007757 [Solanum bulbocastanum]|uniref:Pectinesterase inhibitor domain-containing protein n=1 Tax=Solanum bulbocastanum TaxID=147425 RepID=A0AAN8YI04_SOLBU
MEMPICKTLILPLLTIVLFISLPQTATAANEAYTNFVKTKCNVTTHISLCQKTLIPYASSVYELKQAVDAMGHLGDKDKEFQLANAKTYASSVITDADSCTDGFSGRKVNPTVKKMINSSMANITKLASNALALINHLY